MQKNSSALHAKRNLSLIKIWIIAARPKTLTLSVVPVFTGTILAIGKAQEINWILAFLALICAIFIQIGINIVNDAIDFKKGADTADRLGPQRVVQSGLLSYKQVLNAGLGCFGLALLLGIPLIYSAGWVMGAALFLSVIFGYFYTGGPAPIAYLGLGELFVLIFFGYMITCSVYFLQTGFIDTACLLAATQIGFLAVIPLVVNNMRDISGDRKSNKKTLSARFGIHFSKWEIVLFASGSYLLGFLWIFEGFPMMALMPLLSIPFAYQYIQAIWKTKPSQAYNLYLARSAQSQLIFSLLLCMGYSLT